MLIEYEVDFINENYEKTHDRGIIAAVDWNNAVERLEKYYGKDNIFTFTFTPLEDILVEDEVKEMWK